MTLRRMFSPSALLVVMLSASCATAQDATRTTSAPVLQPGKPVLRIEPADTTLTLDERGFAAAKIRVYNDGGGVLSIERITPSCGCASASVQRNNIDSAGMGMFVIGVNGKNVTADMDVVEWVVESNATVARFPYRVRIKRPTPKE